MKNTLKKTLSIVLAILMVATTVPFAFAADETPDFSDAKVLTSVDGVLYIDGEAAEKSGSTYVLPAGKYKLMGDISTTAYLWGEGEAVLDLNGYIWNLNNCYIDLRAPLSVYDTSTDKTGKITSSWIDTIWLNNATAVFSLYGGTIENTSTGTERYTICAAWASVNLHGGKIVSNGYAVSCSNGSEIDKTLKLGDVVLESGEGYAQIKLKLSSYSDRKEMIIDVTDYTGDALEIDSTIDYLGKAEILKGIKSAEDAEKYKINVEADYSDLFPEKTEYDEESGTKYVCMARNAITQQPTIDNNYTVDFNNPAATFQWYEVEENNIGTHIVEIRGHLFTYDFKAGDILRVSTASEFRYVDLEVGNEYLFLRGDTKTSTIKFDADSTVNLEVMMVRSENPVELEFSVIRESSLDGETGKTLQNPQCGKSYYCKANVGYNVYTSDVVAGHIITSVPAQEETCTTIGWDAYKYCTECDYTTYEEIPATNHKDTLVQVEAKANTCTEIGWDAYEYCIVCDYTTYEEKAVLGHDIVVDAYVAPTCTETGLTEGQHCSRCDDETVAQKEISALGHINEDGDTLCDRCGETILCEDCGRPVHEGLIQNIICWFVMLINLVKSMF